MRANGEEKIAIAIMGIFEWKKAGAKWRLPFSYMYKTVVGNKKY